VKAIDVLTRMNAVQATANTKYPGPVAAPHHRSAPVGGRTGWKSALMFTPELDHASGPTGGQQRREISSTCSTHAIPPFKASWPRWTAWPGLKIAAKRWPGRVTRWQKQHSSFERAARWRA
jgi:hypothetical protein